jgi:hypothetical protein
MNNLIKQEFLEIKKIHNVPTKVKVQLQVKLFLYRPEQALMAPARSGSQNFSTVKTWI